MSRVSWLSASSLKSTGITCYELLRVGHQFVSSAKAAVLFHPQSDRAILHRPLELTWNPDRTARTQARKRQADQTCRLHIHTSRSHRPGETRPSLPASRASPGRVKGSLRSSACSSATTPDCLPQEGWSRPGVLVLLVSLDRPKALLSRCQRPARGQSHPRPRLPNRPPSGLA